MTRKGKNPISSKKKRFFFSHYNDDLPKETLHVYIYSHCNHTQWAPQFKKEKNLETQKNIKQLKISFDNFTTNKAKHGR